MNFKKQMKPNNQDKKNTNSILNILYAPFDGRERVLDAYKSKKFPIRIEGTDFSDKVLDHSNL